MQTTHQSKPQAKSMDRPACAGGCCAPKPHKHGHGHDHGHGHSHGHGPDSAPWRATEKGRQALLCGLALALAYGAGKAAPAWETWIFTAAVAFSLFPIARSAWAAARLGAVFTIETLMTIAAAGAVIIGAAEEAAAVTFLFLVGELLEGVAAGRARAGIESLAALTPKTALLERDGTSVEVAADSLTIGDVVLARPGDRIPADGVVISGDGTVDESPMTGESRPVAKAPGAAVFAGTVNGPAALRIRVTAAAADNTIARIVQRVEEAQESKAPTQRLIERFARVYTPFIVAVAALTALVPPLLLGGDWNIWIYKGLAVLLIGCPCALVISTPAAVAAGLAAGARRGLLLKGGDVLENLGRVTAAAFDKTGTLTEGRPQVTDVAGFALPDGEVLALAAALEASANHPLAKAIIHRAAQAGVTPPPVDGAATVSGKGVLGRIDGGAAFLGSPPAAAAWAAAEWGAGEQTAGAALTPEQQARIAQWRDDGKTVAVLAARGGLAGALALRDEPRDDAQAGVAALRRLGVTVVMLTGDNRRAAAAVGAKLGLADAVHAELSPEDKLRIIRDLQQGGHVVVKIGDGVNDAPALAAADVGVAMGGGTDVALETADAASLGGRVGDVARMIGLSRHVTATIRQNIVIALGLKTVFLITTIAGITGLWPAILADTGATVLVTANALRLLRHHD